MPDTTKPYAVNTLTTAQWIRIFIMINKQVDNFIRGLKSRNIKPTSTYLDEWTTLFNNISSLHETQPNAPYSTANQFLFGNPNTLEELGYEALRVVPSLKPVFTIQRAQRRGEITITIANITKELFDQMLNIHQTYTTTDKDKEKSDISEDNTEDDEFENLEQTSSINTSLQEQVREMDEKLEKATTSIRDEILGIEKTVTSQITLAVQNAIAQAMIQNNANHENLVEAIKDGNRTADKLTGDIKNATDTIANLQEKATTLANAASTASQKAAKSYLAAKIDMENTRDEIGRTAKDLIAELDEHQYQPIKDPMTYDRKPKTYPDEYNIKGKLVQIRTKKYLDDATPISCDSSETLLLTYDLLHHISKQYGILITPIKDIELWDPSNERPTTFPLYKDDFDNIDDYLNAYTSMSIALATKLKTGITFGPKYMAPKLAIDNYHTNGYVMLYNLLKTVHPRLLRNKAVRPTKPSFEGDMNKYLNKYDNWLQFQLHRRPPHHYDHDEIADDIIKALSNSQWRRNLSKGLDIVETKLDRWKATDNDDFPIDLTLPFIGQTIMTYYIENNIDPFHSQRRPDIPAVRAMYQRGRSRSNSRTRTPSGYRNQSATRSRSNSNTSQPNTRAQSQLTDCTICGGQHRSTTQGCPHLYRHVRVQEYVSNNTDDTINRHLQDIDSSRRQRSTSRDSRASRTSQRSSVSRN